MSTDLRKLLLWPLTSVIVSGLALAILIGAWLDWPERIVEATDLDVVLLAAFLCAALVCAGLYPIHIRHNIKINLLTIPLYVATLLLPPAFAALIAAAGICVFELLSHARTGNQPSDIATAAGRWVIITFVCGWVIQQAVPLHLPSVVVLLGIAVLMFCCDALTAVLEIAPMSGESPLRVLRVLVREGGASELVQYLLAILAVLAAREQPWSLVLWVPPLCIVYQSFRRAKEMYEGTSLLLESMADVVDLRDPYTGGHSRRVTEYSMQILSEMGVVGPEVELIRSAARVHDIGKIGIPDQILNKTGRLTAEEKLVMDSHPTRGAELLSRYRDFSWGVGIVLHHHERWDGAGYPVGLKGADIPFGARVVAVADSYDAMTSDRPYRAGMPIGRAARILHEGRGIQWDAAVVDAMLRVLGNDHPEAVADLHAIMGEAATPTGAGLAHVSQ
jgi:HD-GYP domain-containing protein (c-di-GMP phosphodiesterase class II)